MKKKKKTYRLMKYFNFFQQIVIFIFLYSIIISNDLFVSITNIFIPYQFRTLYCTLHNPFILKFSAKQMNYNNNYHIMKLSIAAEAQYNFPFFFSINKHIKTF